MTYYLMIKKSYPYGLKYLCQTRKPDPYSYKGSGKRWLNHLKKHKPNVITCVIGEYPTMDELRIAGKYYSKLFNVSSDPKWANLKDEEGEGGGSGKLGRTWKVKDTSKMKGPKNRKTDKCIQGYRQVAEKMAGNNNPSRRFPRTENQIKSSKRTAAIGTEASKKKIRAFYPNGDIKEFESKRALCYNLSITYDILNYRLKTGRDWDGIKFKEIING